jgi:hypothetical protein
MAWMRKEFPADAPPRAIACSVYNRTTRLSFFADSFIMGLGNQLSNVAFGAGCQNTN